MFKWQQKQEILHIESLSIQTYFSALWFHNVVSLDFGVAVNVFWKHLEDSMYDNKDIYGNKDLQPAARAMQIADRAIKALEELPPVYRDFYARRLVSKIEGKCYNKTHVTQPLAVNFIDLHIYGAKLIRLLSFLQHENTVRQSSLFSKSLLTCTLKNLWISLSSSLQIIKRINPTLKHMQTLLTSEAKNIK